MLKSRFASITAIRWKMVGGVVAILLGSLSIDARAQSLFTHEDLIAMKRLGDIAPAPDGNQVVLQVQTYSYERSGAESGLYLLAADAAAPMQRLESAGQRASDPVWHPEGHLLAYIAPDSNGVSQVFLMHPESRRTQQLTFIHTGARQPRFSPDGRAITFLSNVYPNAPDDATNARILDEQRNEPSSARIYTGFPYRDYGNTWFDGRITHVLGISTAGGEVVDLLAGTGIVRLPGWSGVMEYDWHPEGTRLVFSASTDFHMQADRFDTKDLYDLPVRIRADSSVVRRAEPSLLVDRHTNDRYPAFSPDGRYLAWVGIWCCWGSTSAQQGMTDGSPQPISVVRSDTLPSYKDHRIMVRDMETGTVTVLMANWDRPPNAPVWSSDGASLYFNAPDAGHNRVFTVSLSEALAGASPTPVTGPPGSWGRPHIRGNRIFMPMERTTAPPELYVQHLDDTAAKPRRISNLNMDRLWEIPMHDAREVFWNYAGRTIQGWLVHPPDFDSTQVYPLFLFPHGGPFGMHADRFHYRWNAQLFAAEGYVVFMPNPTGSTGFGESFAADVQGEWGGRVFHEIMAGVDHLLETQPYLREEQMVAASASYGGYLMNWIITQTDRFQAVFTHASIWNFVSMTGSSVIAHYMLMDASGRPPWEDFEAFNRYSPHYHAAAIRTPTYVSHGGMDAGVPEGQALELYWTLQRLGVDTRLLYFPDEGHWVLKPANSRVWYAELIQWMNLHLGR